MVAREHCDNALVIRTHFYGWGGETKKYAEHLVEKLEKGERVKGFVDMYTSPIYVGHLVDAFYKVITSRSINRMKVLNIAGEDGVSRYFFAVAVAEVFGFDHSLIDPVQEASMNLPAARPSNTTLDVSAAVLLGIHTPPLLEGIRAFKAERG